MPNAVHSVLDLYQALSEGLTRSREEMENAESCCPWALGARVPKNRRAIPAPADKALLPGRGLQYSWADSGCSAQQGLAAMGKLLSGAEKIDAVIGPGCSSACVVTSYLAAGQRIPQISYSCTAVSLSKKDEHRLVRLLSQHCFDCSG